jgi:hypothetical protein
MNDFERADKFIQDAKQQMDSPSNMAKFELQQKLADEWMSLSCEQRLSTGKALEEKAKNVDDKEVKASFDFSQYSNTVTRLEFSRYKDWSFGYGGMPRYNYDTLYVHNPMKGCTINDRQK